MFHADKFSWIANSTFSRLLPSFQSWQDHGTGTAKISELFFIVVEYYTVIESWKSKFKTGLFGVSSICFIPSLDWITLPETPQWSLSYYQNQICIPSQLYPNNNNYCHSPFRRLIYIYKPFSGIQEFNTWTVLISCPPNITQMTSVLERFTISSRFMVALCTLRPWWWLHCVQLSQTFVLNVQMPVVAMPFKRCKKGTVGLSGPFMKWKLQLSCLVLGSDLLPIDIPWLCWLICRAIKIVQHFRWSLQYKIWQACAMCSVFWKAENYITPEKVYLCIYLENTIIINTIIPYYSESWLENWV